MKIGICGKMCSGKSTLANYLKEKNNSFYITSFASKLKEIAKDLFDMQQKDRQLLIQIGKKMREIEPNVWVNATIREANKHRYVIIDDVRYENELLTLKKEKWILIKLKISKKLQLQRLKHTYPETWESHFKYINDNSEAQIDALDENHFDYIIDVDKSDPIQYIGNNLKNM
jgi:adenylate kinase family enzyme